MSMALCRLLLFVSPNWKVCFSLLRVSSCDENINDGEVMFVGMDALGEGRFLGSFLINGKVNFLLFNCLIKVRNLQAAQERTWVLIFNESAATRKD